MFHLVCRLFIHLFITGYHPLDMFSMEVIQIHIPREYCQIHYNKEHYLLFCKYHQWN